MLGVLVMLISLVFLILFIRSNKKHQIKLQATKQQNKIQQKVKQKYGHIQIFYGSQTGTAAKMAQSFAEQAIQKGFQPQVIDLKNITFDHFDSLNQISIFFLSNTGQGQAPDNTVKFIKILKQKQHLDQIQQTNWSKNAYSVFGLGNTQYEFYNKTGIDVDALLEKRGAKRIYKIGLGNANASLQDDYVEWKNDLWEVMINYRKENKLERKILENNKDQSKKKESVDVDVMKNRQYLTEQKPQLANFRFYFCHKQSEKYQFNQQELDFKTKGSLKFQKSGVKNIHEVRQNRNDGSTLQLQIQLINQPQYQTASNIALYPQNDPLIVEQIIKYFKFTQKQLSSFISVQKLDLQKKLKLNFIPYCKLRDLLFSHIDIQSRLTKSVLKKLSKFQSSNPEYFTLNSSPKTTAQFKRITQDTNNAKNWFYLFRIIQQQEVKINFEDFVQLSDSLAPRVFTIGSSYNKQKNVIVMASIVENGLISKYFNAQPNSIRAQLRKSTFIDAMKWQKVIFIGAGTGFAPFRGFLQDKQYLMEKANNGQEVKYPKVTLIFGCKYSNGDFIYKNQIQKWVQTQVINKLHMAFSREKLMKVYVQHLLAEQEYEIKEFLDNQNSAVYICGALNMGHDVSQILAQKAGGHEKIKELQQKGRIIKQLW